MGLFDQMLGGFLNNALLRAASSGSLGALINSPMGGAIMQALPGMINNALAQTSYGSLDGVLIELREAGLGDEVASWLAAGPNVPVSTEQLVAALGEVEIVQMASGLGLDPERFSELLAHYLPTVVDRLSPDGVLEMPGS